VLCYGQVETIEEKDPGGGPPEMGDTLTRKEQKGGKKELGTIATYSYK